MDNKNIHIHIQPPYDYSANSISHPWHSWREVRGVTYNIVVYPPLSASRPQEEAPEPTNVVKGSIARSWIAGEEDNA